MNWVAALVDRLTGREVTRAVRENAKVHDQLMRELKCKGYNGALEEIADMQRHVDND